MRMGELASQHDALDAALQAVSDGLAALADPAGDIGTDVRLACRAPACRAGDDFGRSQSGYSSLR